MYVCVHGTTQTCAWLVSQKESIYPRHIRGANVESEKPGVIPEVICIGGEPLPQDTLLGVQWSNARHHVSPPPLFPDSTLGLA